MMTMIDGSRTRHRYKFVVAAIAGFSPGDFPPTAPSGVVWQMGKHRLIRHVVFSPTKIIDIRVVAPLTTTRCLILTRRTLIIVYHIHDKTIEIGTRPFVRVRRINKNHYMYMHVCMYVIYNNVSFVYVTPLCVYVKLLNS